MAGYGFSSNGMHISQPSEEGSAKAMALAPADASLKPLDIDYINAHATSTVLGDSY
ncbi:MAG: hypothetical protein LC132_10710 [Burkholderiales bacterium]|nr:hypothetical protein [Burkholderiales bacterium]